MNLKNSFKGPILFMLMSTTIILGTYSKINKEVTLTVDEQTVSYNTMSSTVEEFLINSKIKVTNGSKVEPNINTKLSNNMEIKIIDKIPVNICDGKETLIHETTKETVLQILEESNIILNEKDKLNKGLDEKISENDTIIITRVDEKIEKEIKKIPFKTKVIEDVALLEGKKEKSVKGESGKLEIKYKIITENGQVVSKEKISEKVIKKPKNEVLKKGVLKATMI